MRSILLVTAVLLALGCAPGPGALRPDELTQTAQLEVLRVLSTPPEVA